MVTGTLRALSLPLAGKSTATAPLGVQSLPSDDGDGVAMILVNDASGSTRAHWWSDDEQPVRIVDAPVAVSPFLTFAEIARSV